MKSLLLCLCCFLSLSAAAAPVSIDMQQITLPELAKLIYGDLLGRSYVLDSSILADADLVTVSIKNVAPDRIESEFLKVLDAHGYEVDHVQNLARIKKKSAPVVDDQVYVYRPLFRSTQYLLDLVSSLFKPGSFTSQGRASNLQFGQISGVGVPGQFNPQLAGAVNPYPQASMTSPLVNQGVNAMTQPDVDVLVFKGTMGDISRLKSVLSQVDLAPGELLVKAAVYEVQTTKKDGSAVDLALSVLSGKLGIKLASGAAAGINQALFQTSGAFGVNAVYSALSSDDRFKQITSPRLRVRSGGSAKFSVGNQTPVLGSVSYDQQGKAVQSIEYKPSGVIFDIKPEVRDEAIYIDVHQQVSQFVPTTTGVNTTPTLNTRELQTSVTAKSGEIILIGGLDDDRATVSDSGVSFLPAFLRSNNTEKYNSQIVLMLQLDRI